MSRSPPRALVGRVHRRRAVQAVAAQGRAPIADAVAVVVEARDELADRPRERIGLGVVPTLQLRLGGQLKPGLLVGAEVTGWKGGRGNADETMWGGGVVAFWYPQRRKPFFWKAGLGVLSYRNEDGQDVLSATAWGLQAGAGYDFQLGPRLCLTPALTLAAGSLGGSVKFNGAQIVSDAGLMLVQLGLSVTRR